MKTLFDRSADAKTIRPRPLKVNLSDSDVKKIVEEAARNGTTVSEIVSGFICDLVGGTQTRGSDERMYAEQYFNRCCYSWDDENTFIKSLIDGGFFEIIAENIRVIELYGDSDDPDDKLDVEEAKAEIAAYYDSYKEVYGNKAEPLKDGVAAVKRLVKEIRQLQGDADPFIAYLNSVYGTLKHENEKQPGAADEKIKLLKAVKEAYKQIKESEG